jgi:radical SAM protein (TIGR01212 family)
MPAMRERFGADHFLAYFQSYTNTYADAAYLEEIYDAALGTPGITGLCIGTRPDCLPEPVLELLGRLSEKHYVSVELGVQSLHDPTLKWLERGHDAESSVRALRLLAERAPKAQTCAHLMFGSPTEPEGIFQTTAQTLSDLPLHGVKLHQLMILERTKLAKLYREAPFHVLELEEYARGVHTFLEHLRPDIYLERLAANATHRDECIAPEWSKTRWETHNTLRELLDSWDTIQGRSLPRTGESFVGASRSTEQALELSASR